MSKFSMRAIGEIRTPFKECAGMPIQPAGADGCAGRVELLPEFRDGLDDLDGFSHAILLFVFHRSEGYRMKVTPFLDDQLRGLFATRAPRRPNPIGMSVVRIDRIEEGILHVQNVDMLDHTPLLDIKPYVPDFDAGEEIRLGWLQEARARVGRHRSDGRFLKE